MITDDHDELCRWLCVCVNETRTESGEEYTPRSITLFIGGLQCYITSEKGERIRLCDPENPSFKPLHRVLDNRFRELHRMGVGTKRKQAEVVSYDEENQLWETGVLCSDTPGGLLRAVFYYNGLNFILRGGQEHVVYTGGIYSQAVVYTAKWWYIQPSSGIYSQAVVYTAKRWYIQPSGGIYSQAVVYTAKRWYIQPSGGIYSQAVVYTAKRWYIQPSGGIYSQAVVYTAKRWYIQHKP